MKIWIRTQEKQRLLKINNIYLDNITEVDLITFDNQTNEIAIGHYKTKERALEILDEIQEHIEKQGQLEILTDNGIDPEIKYYSFVYEMPQE